ncbi:DNA translocase FtsK [Segetibacter sp.]|jgi:S-DNA-T family DNA segregation ATPase FtsK/SpoIIIE|uniref:DNA translocase FtsK n=1 Tax=Segetibacter sp. TaxID=2231182 RepID=UPI00263033DD|nr:DNA translocase FtsK [Segetibacter sp.]MCW3081775.1 cell division protein FtsK [Segetibacter sp.]
MANRIKKKSPPPPNPAILSPDKQEDVTVKEIVKDERTYKIAGTISLLVALFLFVALASYAFTWQDDQSLIFKFGGVKIFSAEDVHVNNLLGVLGAYVAHSFIYKGFGVASFLFCSFFFVLGINLLFGRKVFSLKRNVRYVFTGLIIISVTLAFLFRSSQFSYGGAYGELITDWLIKWIGVVGTGLLLLVAGFSYFVWRFNPTFKWPEKKLPMFAGGAGVSAVSEPGTPEVANDESFILKQYKGDDNNNEARLYIEKEVAVTSNKLKKEGKGVVVLMPEEDIMSEYPLHDLRLVEKEEDELEEEESEKEPEAKFAEVNDLFKLEIKEVQPDEEVEPIIEIPVDEVVKKHPFKTLEPDEFDMEMEIKSVPVFEDDIVEEVQPVKRDLKLSPYDPMLDLRDYKYPPLELLETHGSEKIVHDPIELENNKNQIIATLKNYDIAIQRIAATVGPTVTLYEIVPAPGVRISRIKNLEDDIALSLAALGIRIIAPIPGKGTIGIEVPNVTKRVVSMKTLLSSEKFQHNNYSLPIAIGKKIDNENFIVDLATMPHLLMAGATGQGKSVGLNAILVSLLYKKHPSQLKFVLVDPKKVELSIYKSIEKHFLARLPGEEDSIITDTKKVVHTLNALCIEMDNRYDLLKEAGCRNIKEYNDKFVARRLNPEKGHQFLPFIVLVVDEFADLIMTAGKEVEMPIARLAQLARAVGIHLIIATQRPSVNIITGTIKANFPARIAFKVSSKIDSRTILDAGGAEQLIGKGDMLISFNGEITRLQCAFVDTPEVDSITDYIGDQRGYPQAFLLPEYVDEKELESKDFDSGSRDPLFEDAARLIVSSQIGSTSLIQRRMKLGYNRAGRLMDQLEAAGIVGPNQGSKAREVQVKNEMELEEILEGFLS